MLQKQQDIREQPGFAHTVSLLGLGFTGMLLISFFSYSILVRLAGALGAAYSMDLMILLNDVSIYGLGLPVLLGVGCLIPDGAPLPMRPKRTVSPKLFAKFACVGYAGLYLASLLTSMILMVVRTLLGQPAVDDSLGQMIDAMSPLASLIMVAILPAVLEELVFRAFLYKKLIRFGELPYILLSGFFFGAYHTNFDQFLYAFVLGSWMAYMVCRTGTVIYGMMLHLLVNFYSSNVLTDVMDSMAATTLLGFLIMAVVITGIVLFIKMSRNLFVRRNESLTGQMVEKAVLSPGMIVFALSFFALSVYSLL